jgi:surface polysaccharide O-acyltransferase-like enzyme
MSLTIILTIGILVTIAFHFIGVYAGAKKIVWIAIVIIWAAIISVATSEVKPDAYNEIKQMQGKYKDTDKIIQAAMPKVSVYEMIIIKNSFLKHEPR